MIRVTVSKDGDPILQVALKKDDIIIGRGHEADVQLTSEAVSRRHARLQRTDDGWQVADLGAANGVYVKSEAQAEPERIVIRPLQAGDRIHIEAFTILVEEVEGQTAGASDPFLQVPARDDFSETSLETNRTQFISMVDVLAAKEAAEAADRAVPTVTGPIMRFVSSEAAPVVEDVRGPELPPQGPPIEGPRPSAAPDGAQPAVSKVAAPNAWFARMTSASGHERNFTITQPKVSVGSADTCEIRLPTGPSVIVELERDGGEVSFRRVPLWPFPRVIVGGRAEKRGSLADGESLLVGEYEVTVYLRRAP